ncbi:MAG TPA: hypothetical protein V6C97_19040 [Oculatellaceae cyanobacterium]
MYQSALPAGKRPLLTRGTDQQMGGDRVQNQTDNTRLPETRRVSDSANERMHSDVHQDRNALAHRDGTGKDPNASTKLIEQGHLQDVQIAENRGLQPNHDFRSLSTNSVTDDRPPNISPEKTGSNKSEEAPFTEISRSQNFDPKKPTAAFLDGFHGGSEAIGQWTYVPHGDLSMNAAQKNGFNTIGLDINEKKEMNRTNDYSKQINAVADQIKSGQLPLGKGDVLNISMGNVDPTFDQASKFLGFDVNAQNLASQKDHILSRMNEIANDPSRSDKDRFTAAEVVRTNQAIDRVQNQGVEVVHAAGNDGPDKFSWDFLKAKTDLSSVKPSGKPDSFSASNSNTKSADGILPITHDTNLRPLDPTPTAEQGGTFTVGGVNYPADGKDLFSGNNHIFNRETFNPLSMQAQVTPKDMQLSAAAFSPNRTYNTGEPSVTNLGNNVAPPSDKFSGLAVPNNAPVMKAQPYGPDTVYPYRKLESGEQLTSGALIGTSYSNIDYLKQNYERLKQLKNSH